MKLIKLLLVEDETLVRSLFKDALTFPNPNCTDVSFQIETASDFKSAVNYLETTPTVPDVVILDLRLPSGEPGGSRTPEKEYGFEILKQITSNGRFSKAPVIVFTNLADRESEQRAYKLGATDFIVKSKSSPINLFDRIIKISEEIAGR